MTVTRKEFAGAAAATTLSGSIISTTLSIAVADGSTFPAGTFPFVIVIDRGTASEEKVLCASRSGNTITVSSTSNRGYDGTAAASHSSGAAVEHCLDAVTLTEANKAADMTIGKVTTAGDLLYGTASETLARLGIGTARQHLATNAGATAPEWVASLQSILTTAGDIVYASSANTPARLAKGTASQVLTMNSGATAPEWTDRLSRVSHARVATEETTTSTTFTDLATSGPAVTLDVPASGKVRVMVGALMKHSTTGTALMGFAMSGGNTAAASITQAAQAAGTLAQQFSREIILTGLTAGSTTFTAKYRLDDAAGTGTFTGRDISVEPLQ